jgi:hypothetical protein
MFDQMSLLHFAAGIIAYFWGLPLMWWFIIHVVFEYLENTKMGIQMINKYVPVWPGGKHEKETFVNSMIGDNISALSGWIFASVTDKWYTGQKIHSLTHRNGNTKFKVAKN